MDPPGNARLLAPAALAAFVVVFVVIAATSLGGGDGSPSPAPVEEPATSSTATSTTRRSTATQSASQPRTITVQAGDTPSKIAAREGVDLKRLLALNPDIDPAGLRVGQTLRLAP